MKTETYKEHFFGATVETELELIMLITDGTFPQGDWITNYSHWLELLECCRDCIDNLADYGFVGRKSCADLMNMGMKLLSTRYDLSPPKPWLPVIRELKATPGPCMYDPTEPARRFEARREEWDKYMPKEFQRKNKENTVAWTHGGQALLTWAEDAGIEIKPPYHKAIVHAPRLDSFAEGWDYLAKIQDLPEHLDKLRAWLRQKVDLLDRP